MELQNVVLRARPFDSEEECLDAVLHHKVQKGDAVFIRYEGPKESGLFRVLNFVKINNHNHIIIHILEAILLQSYNVVVLL